MAECFFCETLKLHKEEPLHPSLTKKYFAALAIRIYARGSEMPCGLTTDSGEVFRGFLLNFCPECGRKLEADNG